ncbi:polyhydroxyalkanoate biosynthesis repressor PhaR [Lysinibacillus sp. LZ02]|uniref:polyhydroxyalkanoate biosynthesis repressor PhaR n=1 Tax=Lysinibacillus sp. LZ02 TaxID=3420668 RepID=UPI003D360BB4
MTNKTPFEAFSLWKDLYDKAESSWRDIIQETLEQKSFAEVLGQVQSQYLQQQEFFNVITESYLKQINVPTREDVANTASLIINVETKIIDLEDQLDSVTENTAKEIDSLKRAVTKLDKKLDTVIELLSKPSTPPASPPRNSNS